MLVVLLNLFRMRDDFDQVDQQQAIAPVSLEVIDTKTSFFQMVITPTREGFLLNISPVSRLSTSSHNESDRKEIERGKVKVRRREREQQATKTKRRERKALAGRTAKIGTPRNNEKFFVMSKKKRKMKKKKRRKLRVNIQNIFVFTFASSSSLLFLFPSLTQILAISKYFEKVYKVDFRCISHPSLSWH